MTNRRHRAEKTLLRARRLLALRRQAAHAQGIRRFLARLALAAETLRTRFKGAPASQRARKIVQGAPGTPGMTNWRRNQWARNGYSQAPRTVARYYGLQRRAP